MMMTGKTNSSYNLQMGALLLVFMATVSLNLSGGGLYASAGKIYLYFAFLSWLVLVVSSDYYCLDKMAREETDRDEKISDFIPNAVITVVYFGFVVNAIAKKMDVQGAYAG